MPSHEQSDLNDQSSPNENCKQLIRACESCRRRKIRCLPQDSSDTSTCQRCAKSGRKCIFTVPQSRRRRKRTDTRVAELEHTVQVLAAKLELEQKARLNHDLHSRTGSGSQSSINAGRGPSQGLPIRDTLEQSSSAYQSLRQDLSQQTENLAALRSRGLSLTDASSAYTPSSPSDFSTSERAADVLSISETSPSPSSTLASSDIVQQSHRNYRPSTMYSQHTVTRPTSSPFHGFTPQQHDGNYNYHSSGNFYPQDSSLTFPLPPHLQSWAVPSASFAKSTSEIQFTPANTAAYPPSSPQGTSAMFHHPSTWSPEASVVDNSYPSYNRGVPGDTRYAQVRSQPQWYWPSSQA